MLSHYNLISLLFTGIDVRIRGVKDSMSHNASKRLKLVTFILTRELACSEHALSFMHQDLQHNLWLKNPCVFDLLQSNMIANHKWPVCARYTKARRLISNDCTSTVCRVQGRDEGFTSWVLRECFAHLAAVTVYLKAPAEPGQPWFC